MNGQGGMSVINMANSQARPRPDGTVMPIGMPQGVSQRRQDGCPTAAGTQRHKFLPIRYDAKQLNITCARLQSP